VREVLLSYFGTIGTPRKLVLDPGKEFQNAIVRNLLEEFAIEIHVTTPGHPKSHAAVERAHNTMSEHLRLLQQRGITGQEAVARTVVAYNHTIHSATGRTPIELMRSWQREDVDTPIEQEREQIGAREETRKEGRTQKRNREREWLRPKEIRVGQRVFVKNLVKRRKTDLPFCGPFEVRRILGRHRVVLEKVGGNNPRPILRHLDEIRIQRRGTGRC
jgi:hypothetical protein